MAAPAMDGSKEKNMTTRTMGGFPQIALLPRNQRKFDRLAAGENISARDVEAVRTNLDQLLVYLNSQLFISSRPDFKEWVKRSQNYTGHVVEVLESYHFRAK